MSDFVIGDYAYTIVHSWDLWYDSNEPRVAAKVSDTSKTSYHSIPKHVEYNNKSYTVVDLGGCFSSCSYLIESPSIPDSVRDMHSCFSSCTSLSEPPSIPSGVTNMQFCFTRCVSLVNPPVLPPGVGNLLETFRGCTSLVKAPSIPSGVAYIGYCFQDCESLEEVPNLPETVTDMTRCFQNCKSLKTVPSIPSKVTSMVRCFEGCVSLISAPAISSNVLTSMQYAFSGCTSLRSVPALPDSVTNMTSCFLGCESLVSCTHIPSSATAVDSCFSGCKALTTGPTAIPEGITSVFCIFNNCVSLKNAPSIPSTVTDMYHCFYNCESLKGNITVSNTELTNGSQVFYNTKGPLYIIPTSTASEDLWRNWLRTHTTYGSVYILADENPQPVASLAVKRVGSSDSIIEDPDGLFAFITIQITVYKMRLPDGYTNELKAITLTKDGEDIDVLWIDDDSDDDQYKITYVKHTWVPVTTARLLFSIVGFDLYKQSTESSAVLSKTTMLLDALAGNIGLGMAIGKRATREGLDISLKTYLDRPVDINGEMWFPTFFKDNWSESSDESTLPITPCLVLSISDGGLYYCDGE